MRPASAADRTAGVLREHQPVKRLARVRHGRDEKHRCAERNITRVDGRVRILLLIDEFGVVNDVSVVDAKPEGYFEEATLAFFRAVRFSPGQKQGHPVKSRALLTVSYLYGESAGAMR